MSTIAWAEFLCGPLETSQADLARQIVSDRMPFSEEDASAWALSKTDPPLRARNDPGSERDVEQQHRKERRATWSRCNESWFGGQP